MQNLFKRSKSTTLPANGMAYQSNHPGETNSATSLTMWQRNLFRGDYNDDYSDLMEIVHQRVYDEHGAQIADVRNDLVHAIGLVLDDVAREREEIKQHYLQQIENTERERYSREKACYEAAVARLMANSGSLPTPAQPNTMQPETISSVLTRYSDPFQAVYPYEPLTQIGYIQSADYESAPPPPARVASLLSDLDSFAGYPEAINHNINNNDISSSSLDSVHPGYAHFEEPIGIRLVPKSSTPRSMTRSAASSHLTTPSVYSQESEWYYAQWPSPPPLRYTDQPVPSSPSPSFSTIAETIKPIKYAQTNQSMQYQGPSRPGYVLTQSVNGPRSPFYSNTPCDEFGRLSLAST